MNAIRTAPMTLFLLGPFLACVWLGVRRTLLVGCAAAALGLALGLSLGLGQSQGQGALSTGEFGVGYGGLLAGCALAPYAAARRTALRRACTEAREAARGTQQLILRPLSRELAGTHVCTRYHCAAPRSAIGGDLYDTAVTPYGLRVLVGDVRGHGVEALRLTAATVAAFRELAYTAPDLPALVTDLDKRLTPELEAEDFVTAVLAEFAPGEVRLVNCGHPAPLRAGRRVELLEPFAPVTPLGLAPDPRQYRVRLAPGDRLLLYTDGLTEARSPEGVPFPLLPEATLALREPLPDDALDSLYGRLVAHTGARPVDDLALVLCQPSDAPAPVPAAASHSHPSGRD